MKLYIASHSQDEGRAAAKLCEQAGHEVVSSWLHEDWNKTTYSDAQRIAIAGRDESEVRMCDALLLLASPRRVAGGKFVEAGIAIGLGKRVYVAGHRENMLMWHPYVERFDSVEDFLTSLSRHSRRTPS